MPGTRKLGKTTDQRMAMLRQQVTDFLDNGKMETTVTRAKEIKPVAEKMITLGKKGDLAAYRQAMSFITREDVCKKLFKEIAPGYAERNGGYTRIVRTGVRRGDAAETAEGGSWHGADRDDRVGLKIRLTCGRGAADARPQAGVQPCNRRRRLLARR